jgi:hypothetical protein
MDLGSSYIYFCNITTYKLKLVFHCGKSAIAFRDLPKYRLDGPKKGAVIKLWQFGLKKQQQDGHWLVG